MNSKTIAISVALAGLLLGGILMSQGTNPTLYTIPQDLAWYSATLRCPTGTSSEFANYVSWDATEKRVVVGIQEKNQSTGEWISEQYVYSTSYNVLDVAFRLGGQVLYVSGIQLDRNGGYTDVIEEWTFPTPAGGYAVTVAGGTTGIGTPRASFAGTATLIGPAYVAPQVRHPTVQPVPDKRILYSEASSGHFDCIVADPEGRTLLVHNYTTGNLMAIDLSVATPTLQSVYTATQIPALAACRSIVLHDVPNVGRICRLSPENGSGANPTNSTQTVILVDSQNDAVFEAFTTHSLVQVANGQSPYGESINWKSVTNFGWDWQSEF